MTSEEMLAELRATVERLTESTDADDFAQAASTMRNLVDAMTSRAGLDAVARRGETPGMSPENPLGIALSARDERNARREAVTARNFTEFLRNDRQHTDRILNGRRELANRVNAQLASQFGVDLGQVDETGRPIGTESTDLDRVRAGQQFLGLPQGFVPEFQMSSSRMGGLTNPDAMASWRNNTAVAQRQIATDALGRPLGEDGLPLADPATGEPRPGVEPLYDSENVIGPDLYDEIDTFMPTSMSPQERRRLQARLVRAGVAPEGAQVTGAWTQGWAQALGSVMAYANINGTRWTGALTELQAQQELGIDSAIGELRKQFDAEQAAFRPPDQTALRNEVVNAVRTAVRRAPTSEEMATLLGDMSSSYRAAYDADRRAAEAEFAASIQHPLEGIPDDLRTDEDRAAIDGFGQQLQGEFGVPGAEVAQIDPTARFEEKFRHMFESRLERQGERAGHEDAQAAMSQRAGSLLSRLGGRV